MTNLYDWYCYRRRPEQVFRSQDFRVWFVQQTNDFRVAWRGPLWSRLPVRRFKTIYEVATALGCREYVRELKGTVK